MTYAPPYLIRLANLTKLDLSDEHKTILASLNPHYIGTKYPEDIAKMFRMYNKKKVEAIYEETKKIYRWLKKQIK